jgi:hypothetical protein
MFYLETDKGRGRQGDKEKNLFSSFPLLLFTFQILQVICSKVLADLKGEIPLSDLYG